MNYRVDVDDNFHYRDESERYTHGVYQTAEEAIMAARKLVDDFLLDSYEEGMSATELYSCYTNFGDDPFIISEDENCRFSAWDYAKKRCDEICGPGDDIRSPVEHHSKAKDS